MPGLAVSVLPTARLPEIVGTAVLAGAAGVWTAPVGADTAAWREYDASELVARRAFPGPILIDQGAADPFLAEQLMPEKFSAAAAKSGQRLELRLQPGYDHGYYFIQTFMADHLRHHAQQLNR